MHHRERSVLIGSALVAFVAMSASCASRDTGGSSSPASGGTAASTGGAGDEGAGGATSCPGLPETECSQAGCHAVFGRTLVKDEVREVYAGCLSAVPCGSVETCAYDESGACFWFPSNCYPQDFKEVLCGSDDSCAELRQAVISAGQ